MRTQWWVLSGYVLEEIERVAVRHLFNCHFAFAQSNLTFKWHFNNTLEMVVELPAHMLNNVASVGDLGGPDNQPFTQSLYGAKTQHQQPMPGYNSIERQPSKTALRHHHQQQQQGQRSQQREENLNSGHLYPYKIDTFSNFGTVTCYAENSFGNSGPCYYHILAAGTSTPLFSQWKCNIHVTRFIPQNYRTPWKIVLPSTLRPARCRFSAWPARTAAFRSNSTWRWWSNRRGRCWWTSRLRCPSSCWSVCQVTRRS